jgi:hypothetical protein
MMAIYRHFGLTTASTWRLPLPEMDVDAQHVDVHVHPGAVILCGDPVWSSQIGPDCAFYTDGDRHIADWGTAKFDIAEDHVTVAANENDISLQLLLFPVWAALLSMRGRDALHGAVVERDGRGLAIFGESGHGKTTACLRLIDMGWRLVTDDLITFDDSGKALVGPPFMRLRADRATDRVAAPDGAGKFRFLPPLTESPVELTGAIILTDQVALLRPLSPVEAVQELLTAAYNVFPTTASQSVDWFKIAVRLTREIPMWGAPPRSLSSEQLYALASR